MEEFLSPGPVWGCRTVLGTSWGWPWFGEVEGVYFKLLV